MQSSKCYVTGDYVTIDIYFSSFKSVGLPLLDDGYDVNFFFENQLMTIIQTDLFADVRRLTTESYASNPANPMATKWAWYWKDEDGVWLLYGVDHQVS